jgi:hypothetical protein
VNGEGFASFSFPSILFIVGCIWAPMELFEIRFQVGVALILNYKHLHIPLFLTHIV